MGRFLDGDDLAVVPVVLYGYGSVNRVVHDLCREQPSLQVVGIIARSSEGLREVDRTLAPSALVGAGAAKEVLTALEPAVVLHATTTTLGAIIPQLEQSVAVGANVISTSEELAGALLCHPEASHRLDAAARASGVSVVGTGVNPGYVFDVLPAGLASAETRVDQLEISRTLDASVFGRRVQDHLGLGYPVDGFREAAATGQLRGHRGFRESAEMLCASMGRHLERFEEHVEPVLADRPIHLEDWTIQPGTSAGIIHEAEVIADGRVWARFRLRLHVALADVGWTARDQIDLAGATRRRLVIEPGYDAILTTAARMVNSIPAILTAEPGLLTPLQLPPTPPWAGGPPNVRRPQSQDER